MIEIQVVSRAGAALEVPLAARFGDAGGDVGRGVDCTLVLPDPERRISRRQVLGGEMMLHALRELDRAELRSASPPPRISLIKKADIPRGLLRD